MKKLILPEPNAVREVHLWRRRIQKRAEKIGWDKYLAEINSRPSLLVEPRPMKPRHKKGAR
jgi:hypothetical protein